MSLDLLQPDAQPLTHVDQLVEYFRQAERPRAQHRVGLEHEKFVYPQGGATPVAYEGERGIAALLGQLSERGLQAFREGPGAPVIALTRDQQAISLEPGGQLELSGSPFLTAREAHQENLRHLEEVKAAAKPLGLSLVALGYRPYDSVPAMPWMPKSRYRVMRQSLGPRGGYALNMMLMTATGQVSLDWEDEADCARKVTLAARLSPLLVALYANSPLVEGQRSGFVSFRSQVWTDVDVSRCGYLPSMFDGSFSYRSYTEWALDAPLLFVRRDGQYLTPQLTFRQLLQQGYQGGPARQSDWVDHLSTLFPEVRIKRLMEIRGADSVSAELTGALLALCRGLFYSSVALDEVEALLPSLTMSQHLAFAETARREGLRGRWGSASLGELSVQLVEIARRGLERLDPADLPLLDPLAEQAASGRSPAERVVEVFDRCQGPAQLLEQFQL